MVNEAEDGKDFIQGFFSQGESFGEPPIFESGEYPASAIAVERAIIIRLCIRSFVQLLRENFEVHWKMTTLLSQRIKKKTTALKDILFHSPERRKLSLLDNFKMKN